MAHCDRQRAMHVLLLLLLLLLLLHLLHILVASAPRGEARTSALALTLLLLLLLLLLQGNLLRLVVVHECDTAETSGATGRGRMGRAQRCDLLGTAEHRALADAEHRLERR